MPLEFHIRPVHYSPTFSLHLLSAAGGWGRCEAAIFVIKGSSGRTAVTVGVRQCERWMELHAVLEGWE